MIFIVSQLHVLGQAHIIVIADGIEGIGVNKHG